ncbi:unnamed protein product, partial [Brenthis ino]
MKGLRVFMFIVATTILPCKSTPDDIDDFNRISSSLPQPKHGGLGVRFKDEKHTRELEMQASPQSSSPFLSQFVHEGNNLFFKPQVLFGSIVKNNPYISHPPIVNDEKELVVSENPMPPSIETISKEDENASALEEEITKKKLPEIPEAPILPPFEMPVLPQVVGEEPEVRIEDSAEKIIIDEKHIIIPEPPTFSPSNLPELPMQIFSNKLVPGILLCTRIDNDGNKIAVPCPNLAQPPYSDVTNFMNIVENKAFIRPLSTRIPLSIPFQRPIETVMPFREDLTSTRFLPCVTVSKFPLNESNRKFLINPHHGGLSKC